jgi:alpha-L-arabinofuranosidase
MHVPWQFSFGSTQCAADSTLKSHLDHSQRAIHIIASLSLVLFTLGCNHAGAQKDRPDPATNGVTDIGITNSVAQTGLKRLGVNISGQNFYDSGQISRNLVLRNPGFEGQIWQSILRCRAVTATSCTDGNQWAQWPANFLEGAQFEFISGNASGVKGTVISSVPADGRVNDQGVRINFAQPSKVPSPGDFVVVRKTFPGNGQAGWWVNNAGIISTEFSDLPPGTTGKQALKITAPSSSQSAEVASYFDYSSGHAFLRLTGPYRLHFWAKGIGGNNKIQVTLIRQSRPGTLFIGKEVGLSNNWREYNINFSAAESGNITSNIALKLNVSGASALIDDVSLAPATTSSANTTAFRDEVVSALKTLHPGVLRWNDGANTGSSLDNAIAGPFARMRAGATTQNAVAEDISIGLHEFLQLCQVVGAEPYYVMPPGMSTTEAKDLIEYLAGASSTPYGAKRAARGQVEPWTTVFPTIHLELGNEEWNAIFPGAAIPDAAVYGSRAKAIFTAMRQSPAYVLNKFDLIVGAFFVQPERTKEQLSNSGGYDSTAVAPYLFNNLSDVSSNEAIFGPMFSQPEMYDSRPSGLMGQQSKMARAVTHPANLIVYEVNLSTTGGSAPQSSFDAVVPSLGAGLTVAEHMLLMMRDLGVKTQAAWSLSGYNNNFKNSSTGKDQTTPLFGIVVDMGGETNLRRPQFLALELANQAILPTMLTTTVTGANPTWNQKHSDNDNVQIEKAHYLQTFAFSEGASRSVIVFNLSRSEALPITFSGVGAPSGTVQQSQLTAKNITDTNELTSHVAITDSTLNSFDSRAPYSLPPFSMTVFKWNSGH